MTRAIGAVLVRRTLMRAGMAGILAMSMAGVAVPIAGSAATACVAPPAPPLNSVAKNIDTTQGCDVSAGNATNPTTGWMTVTTNLAPLFLTDLFQAGSGGPFYAGTYTATFTSCTGGTASSVTYNIDSTGHVVAGVGAIPVWTVPAPPASGATMSCQYSIAYSGTPPAGVSTLQNSASFADPVASVACCSTASVVVQTFGAPSVAEVPLAVALPIAGGLIVGAFALYLRLVAKRWSRRRTRLPSPATRF